MTAPLTETAAVAAAADCTHVAGIALKPLEIRPATLRAMPVELIAAMRLVARDPAIAGTVSEVRGVRLRDVLEHAGIDRRDHNQLKKLVIIATSADGYMAVFSWHEIFNTEVGASVLVIFERDGQPLSAKEGPLALIACKDYWTGPRHVKALHTIEVRQIVD